MKGYIVFISVNYSVKISPSTHPMLSLRFIILTLKVHSYSWLDIWVAGDLCALGCMLN